MPRLRPQWQELAGGVVAGVATSALVRIRHLVDEVLAAAVGGDQLQRHVGAGAFKGGLGLGFVPDVGRSEEHTSELQSLMRISYAVFCLKKKKTSRIRNTNYSGIIYTMAI